MKEQVFKGWWDHGVMKEASEIVIKKYFFDDFIIQFMLKDSFFHVLPLIFFSFYHLTSDLLIQIYLIDLHQVMNESFQEMIPHNSMSLRLTESFCSFFYIWFDPPEDILREVIIGSFRTLYKKSVGRFEIGVIHMVNSGVADFLKIRIRCWTLTAVIGIRRFPQR